MIFFEVRWACEPKTHPLEWLTANWAANFSIEVGFKAPDCARKWSRVPKHRYAQKSLPVSNMKHQAPQGVA